jgi:hypothetical protein
VAEAAYVLNAFGVYDRQGDAGYAGGPALGLDKRIASRAQRFIDSHGLRE